MFCRVEPIEDGTFYDGARACSLELLQDMTRLRGPTCARQPWYGGFDGGVVNGDACLRQDTD